MLARKEALCQDQSKLDEELGVYREKIACGGFTVALQKLDYYFVIATTKVVPIIRSNPSNLYCMAKTGLEDSYSKRASRCNWGVFNKN